MLKDEDPSMGSESEKHSRSIRRGKLGEGWYFYHVAPVDRLDSIRRLGLTTPTVHRMPTTYSLTEGVTNRLWLYPKEETAIQYLFVLDHVATFLLRFRTEMVDNFTPYHDPGYAQNESAPWRTVTEVYSFSMNATIPPQSLQACSLVRRAPGPDKWSTENWVSLDAVAGPIRKYEKGRISDIYRPEI